MTRRLLSQGAEVVPDGVRYRVWAPEHSDVAVELCDGAEGPLRPVPLSRVSLGYHQAIDAEGRPGDLYKYRLGSVGAFPCPASRWQPLGINGPSMVVDPANYAWSDLTWVRPLVRDLVIYEIHVGTFTPAGTFRGAMEKFAHLRDLGINAIELMPIADFSGEHNWGYDGVRLYAPARPYGHPDDLRAFVDAAQLHGLAVILDVVYNHFGPDGNFLSEFSPHYFESRHHTPWGDAINFHTRAAPRLSCPLPGVTRVAARPSCLSPDGPRWNSRRVIERRHSRLAIVRGPNRMADPLRLARRPPCFAPHGEVLRTPRRPAVACDLEQQRNPFWRAGRPELRRVDDERCLHAPGSAAAASGLK